LTGADTLPRTAQRSFPDQSEVCIALPSLGFCPAFQRLRSFRLIREDLNLLLAFGANEASVAHQPDRT
jgi:hypothetical protein